MHGDDDDSLLSNTPPSAKRQKTAPAKKPSGKPLSEVENESFAMDASEAKPKAASKSKTATETYQKLTQLEHILKRPDTYVGSVEKTEQKMWVYNSELEHMEFREVTYVPGLYKIFDEILVNAADNKQRDKNMDKIKVVVDAEEGFISVENNGRGIPIEIHEKEGVYIPELIFGHLLSSSNYDDNEAKVTGGRNGFGAKLCNVFSTRFDLETVDSRQKKKYKQMWTENMTQKDKAKITDCKGSDDYTKVTFRPDFAKFGMDKMDDDFKALVERRVYDMAGTCKGVRVSLNNKTIGVRSFKKYMEMYTKAIAAENLAKDEKDAQVIITDDPHERWQVGFAVSDGSFQQVSFVNSIATTSGGSHVNYIADQITDKLADIVKKKNKGGVQLKPAQIRNHMFLFVNCLITNPAFTSQTKEQMTTKVSQFGSRPTVSDKFLKAIEKTDVVNNIIRFAQAKADQMMKKSDGNRRSRMNHSKLTDANKAGTRDGYQCTLILTEGDSASLLALAGRAVVDPDRIGVFPLRGKVLNVRDASIDQITKNAEIQNIKKFIGLQHKKVYEDTKSLRYGHIMIMTDQDHDGSHIKGLLINFLECQYPSLLRIPGFLQEFITPIVKVWKGDPKAPKKLQSFFTMPEYEDWKKLPGNERGWDHKYYKGLGTSSPADAEVYFRDLDRHLKQFHTMQEHEPALIDLAFSKKKADARKEWLREFVPGTFLDMRQDLITYDDFINKELILFSMADNMRSIPSVIDGFKPGQRKVLYTCFRRNLKKDVKVVELAGSVSGLTAYAYGESSLQQTIVGLAQTFVGSNNVNTLEPSGNFGSRLQGGQDCASARYIYTRLSPFARKVFNPKDEPLLRYNLDDGKEIEPEVYVPVVPMVLINGADGIGTGWSTSIPNYNPEDIVNNLRKKMHGEDMEPMQPWFRGFTGEVAADGDTRFRFSGIIKTVDGSNEIEVTELPIRYWTQDFKDKLEDILKAEKTPAFFKDYTEYNTPDRVHFIIKFDDKQLASAEAKGFDEVFKLSKTMATTNLVAFDKDGRIMKYSSPLDMLEEFYQVRIRFYQQRKQYMLSEMEKDLTKLNNQARFVKMIVDNKLVVSKKKKSVLVAELEKLGFDRIPKKVDARKQGEFEPTAEDEDAEEAAENQQTGAGDYDYLLGMAIWSLTEERIAKLMQQVGDKEEEIENLTKTTKEQLWEADLDDFIGEWRFQLEDDARRVREGRRAGRRASRKLKIDGKTGQKKRKGDDDDDDFAVSKSKKTAKAKSSTLSSYFTAKEVKPSAAKSLAALNPLEQLPVSKPPAVQEGNLPDSSDDDKARLKAAAKSTAKTAAPKSAARLDALDLETHEEDEFFRIASENMGKKAAPARGGRAAATKRPVYTVDSGSDSDGLGGLGDITDMVKARTSTAAEAPSRTLYKETSSRPTSSSGVGASAKAAKPVEQSEEEDGMSETDYKSLAQDSKKRPTSRIVDDDDDSDSDIAVVTKPAMKAAAEAKAPPVTKTKFAKPPQEQAAKKPAAQSPAAKAYAKKIAKNAAPALPKLDKPAAAKPAAKPVKGKKKVVESDEEDEVMDDADNVVNDLLKSDDENEESEMPQKARRARPGRAAAAAPKSKYVEEVDSDLEDFIADSESEEEYGEDDDDD